MAQDGQLPPGVLERCGSNSPTEVVGPMPEGCDLHEQRTGFLVGYPRAPFASVVTGRSALSPPTLRKTLCHLIGDSVFPSVDGSVAFATGCSGREDCGHPWQGPGRTLAGTPKKGVRDPPKRGGAGILNNVNFGGFNRS